MAFDINQLIRLGKKLLPHVKKWWKKRQQQQQQEQQQQQNQQGGQQPYGQQQQYGGGGGGAWGQQQGNPYPPAQGGGGGYGHQQQHQQPNHHYQPAHQIKPESSGAIGPNHPGHQVEPVPFSIEACRGEDGSERAPVSPSSTSRKAMGTPPTEVEVLLVDWLARQASPRGWDDECRLASNRRARRSRDVCAWSKAMRTSHDPSRTRTVISVFPLALQNRHLTSARFFSNSSAHSLPRHPSHHPPPHPRSHPPNSRHARRPPTPHRHHLHPLHPSNPTQNLSGPIDPLADPPVLRSRPPISLRPPAPREWGAFHVPPRESPPSVPAEFFDFLTSLDQHPNSRDAADSIEQPLVGPTYWMGVQLPFRVPTILLDTFRRHPQWLAATVRAWLRLPRFLWPKNQDQLNASNAQYVALRNKAIQESDLMGKCFDQSHRAYSAGDGAKAKELSNEGHMHQREKERLNHEAAEWIFNENNKHSPQGTIDLHGLFVQEAISYTEQAIQRAQQQGLSTLRVIVGKGIHSAGHVAKIKPAIEDLMRKYNLAAHLDPHNTGVLVVDLSGRTGSRDAGFADQLANGGEQCLVM